MRAKFVNEENTEYDGPVISPSINSITLNIKEFIKLTYWGINDFRESSSPRKGIYKSRFINFLYHDIIRYYTGKNQAEINEDDRKKLEIIYDKVKLVMSEKPDKYFVRSEWMGRRSVDSTASLHNFYITIQKDFKNISNFISNLGKLNKRLQNIANSWKTNSSLDHLLANKDNLKIYWAENSKKEDIIKIVNNWLDEFNIKKEERTHDIGYDTGGHSFGQLAAYRIEQKLMMHIIKLVNEDKMDYDKVVKYLADNILDLVKKYSKFSSSDEIEDFYNSYVKNYREEKKKILQTNKIRKKLTSNDKNFLEKLRSDMNMNPEKFNTLFKDTLIYLYKDKMASKIPDDVQKLLGIVIKNV